MPLTVPVFESMSWPWPEWTLHVVYLFSGTLIAVHYGPQIRRAWLFPAATLAAQSLSTWTVWTVCRLVAFVYGIFVVHDLLFLVVVGADIAGRLAMVASILRAYVLEHGGIWSRACKALRRPRVSRLYSVLAKPPPQQDHYLISI